jgi:zinc protease
MGGATTPLVSIYLMLPTGSATDPGGKEGLSLLSADMLDEGAGKLNALELSDRLGELATDYASQAGVDYVLLSMDGLTENLEQSLALLADIVQRPKLSKEEFDRRKEHHLATALAQRDDPAESRDKALNRVLFGKGYAAGPPEGTKDSLQSITLADVKRHVKGMTVPDGAQLAVAGKFDSTVLQKAVEASFGKWKGKLTPQAQKVETPTVGKAAYVVDFPGATQSSLAVVTRAGSDQDPNYFPEEVMNEKLGGSFISRINMNLREDKGYTYGAFSTFRRYKQAGYFGVLTNVKTETTGASVAEIFKELGAVMYG